jgi:hypothetical protein
LVISSYYIILYYIILYYIILYYIILAIKGDSARAVENYSNGEMCKIAWATRNKIRFNDEKSKIMLVTRRKYGFTPQKSTVDAAMELKNFVMEGLAAGKVTAIINLDVKGAFDAAFWPSILTFWHRNFLNFFSTPCM